jgi:hypothetical protein
MLQIQSPKFSKLFYNKWPYKVECVQLGASFIRHGVSPASANAMRHNKELSAFITAAIPFLNNKSVQIRTENRHFNLFCKDVEILEEITTRLRDWIVRIVGPATQAEYDFVMNNSHKKILCKHELPKGKYKYRIYINTKLPRESRKPFLNSCKRLGMQVEFSKNTTRWLEGETYYMHDPFMYVYDEKVLTMVGLYLSGHVKKVEEFVVQ